MECLHSGMATPNIIEIIGSHSLPNLPSQSSPSNNWHGFPSNSIPGFTTNISFNCLDIIQQAKATCSTLRVVQDYDVVMMQATLDQFHVTCEELSVFCAFLKQMHTNEYYAQGNGANLQIEL